ncbi:CaiB/BaiF CoA transferase family protein [Saccharothrix sp. NRRL B-16348]|uniref:CaiB/BaiF CoA transferase family protein n=1 Tax=Saccharothrix sp. NRRL B-16348 TaxID=1415542 RepID=UPI0006AF2C88|nr:CaiB/BaiF CoA-transferase family protein [Saccharothrix sp. NRRL B-16348]
MPGPLEGLRVLEIGGSVAGAYASTVLADLGADVLRVDRATQVPGEPHPPAPDPLARGRRSAAVDLRHPDGPAVVLGLVEHADVVVEGGRPGVAEKLGIGPEQCLERNPALVYGRVSGWGQDGPMARRAGHDITFLGVTGALAPTEPGGAPAVPPPYYLSSFAGGALPLVIGIQAALLERARSGRGQVVDAAIVEGTALLAVMVDQWRRTPGRVTVVDAPFYRTYPCADGRHVSVGAVEPHFYRELLDRLDLGDVDLPEQYDEAGWPVLTEHIAAAFGRRDSTEWEKVFADSDACVAPVLAPSEVAEHPQLKARGTFVDVGGQLQPGLTPRLSRTPAAVPTPAPYVGQHTVQALRDWGLAESAVDALLTSGAVKGV